MLTWCNFKFDGVPFNLDTYSKGPHNLTSTGPHLS
jgi:hypothetical protein